MISRLLLLFVLVACATPPTPYQKEKKKEGYNDSTFDGLRVATFRANSESKKEKAELYAEFRAIENCRQENKLTNIIDAFDKSTRKDVLRTSGSGFYPSYSFATYPYYSRYSTFGVGVGYYPMYTQSWPETYIYPIFEVYYTCSDKIYRPQLVFREITPDEMKVLVKDLKGGIQLQSYKDNSPNEKTIELNDIILKANGKRIEKVYELISMFNSSKDVVSVEMRREGEKVFAKLRAVDVTGDVEKAEKDIIQKVCSDKKFDNQKILKKSPLCK